MSIENITRREFIERTIGFGMALSVSGCSLKSKPSEKVPNNSFFLLQVESVVTEKTEHIDPRYGHVVAFSPDFFYTIEDNRLLILSEYYDKHRLDDAVGIFFQHIRYHGGISGMKIIGYPVYDVSSATNIRSGYPGERFDGVVQDSPFLDVVVRLHAVGSDGSISIGFCGDYVIKPGQKIQVPVMSFDLEIDHSKQEQEYESWRNVYSNIRRTHFDVATEIMNQGLWVRQEGLADYKGRKWYEAKRLTIE